MRRAVLIGCGAALVALALCACDLFRDSSTNVVVTQGQGQTGTSASPSPSPSTGVCPPVVSVNAHVIGSSVVAVGSQVTLDATPVRSGPALDPAAEKACNEAAGVAWSAPQFPCKLLTGDGPFNPIMTSESVGVCSSAPTVQGITGPDVTVEFR